MTDQADHKAELKGIITLNSTIEAESGLFIGGTDRGISIGGADDTVVRNSLSNEPYIPGSSLRGRMRSLLDQVHNNSLNETIQSGSERTDQVKLHLCEDQASYNDCLVCQLFGVTSSEDFVAGPTRLLVSDCTLTNDAREKLDNNPGMDMPMTEIKTEVAIDRLTSAAVPRKRERVPAGVGFESEFSLQLYDTGQSDDLADLSEYLGTLTRGLRLIEETYLGGQGSRGYGRVTFTELDFDVTLFGDETLPIDSSLLEKTYTSAKKLDGAFH